MERHENRKNVKTDGIYRYAQKKNILNIYSMYIVNAASSAKCSIIRISNISYKYI